MSSNYRPNAGSKKSIMTPMITGIVIGLLAGVLLALGFAIWLNRNATPFVEKTKSVDLLPTKPAREPAKGEVAQPTPTTTAGAAKENADKPRFDFYQILPGEKDSTKKDSTKKDGTKKDGTKYDGLKADIARSDKAGKNADELATKSAARPAPSPNAVAKNAEADVNTNNAGKDSAKPAAKDSYLLQAGAFQSESDAENLKAKIAFAGMEANVRSVNLPDKGTLYRVRLGPYRSLDEVNRIKAALSQNGISAAVVKTE